MKALEAQKGSYAWRSILKGRGVLKDGMRWLVGDGTTIQIWSDPWLPSKFLPYVTSSVATGWEDARMCSLIKPVSKALQTLFLPKDISLIESIPLASIPIADKLFWPFTPLGSYIVKSGYWFLYKAQSFDNHDY